MDILQIETEYLQHKSLSILETTLEQKRQELSGIEEWEFIDDIKELKSDSPKAKAYRRSAIYRFLKYLRLIVDSNQCQKCGGTQNLHLHHIHYRTYFKERLQDVRILCTTCHIAGHEAQKQIFNQGITGTTQMNHLEERAAKAFQRHRDFCFDWTETFVKQSRKSPKIAANIANQIVGHKYAMSENQVQELKKECGLICQNRDRTRNYTLFSPNTIRIEDKDGMHPFSDTDLETRINRAFDDVLRRSGQMASQAQQTVSSATTVAKSISDRVEREIDSRIKSMSLKELLEFNGD